MARILVNAVAAKMGGAITYLTNFKRVAMEQREHSFEIHVAPGEPAIREQSVSQIPAPVRARGGLGRLWYDQIVLRERARHFSGLISTSNFGTFGVQRPQVLLVRNALYFSRLYMERLQRDRPRLIPALLARRAMVAASAAAVDWVVFPTKAMRDEALRYPGFREERCRVIPHGFDPQRFLTTDDRTATLDLPPSRGPKVLMVSHYALHKDLGTLLEGFRIFLRKEPAATLLLTAELDARSPELTLAERRLWNELKVTGRVVDLGTVPYGQIAAVYRWADVFAFTSLAESFAHPLAEAIATKLPIAASDIPVHREVCGAAGSFFPPGDAQAFAASLGMALAKRGASRLSPAPEATSWSQHVATLCDLIDSSRS
ncbi:MAG: glycosyltransferase [Myxococcales bacterium]